MTEWALLKNGRIVSVVTTSDTRSEVQRIYPGYEVKDIYTLPSDVQQGYRFWDERP